MVLVKFTLRRTTEKGVHSKTFKRLRLQNDYSRISGIVVCQRQCDESCVEVEVIDTLACVQRCRWGMSSCSIVSRNMQVQQAISGGVERRVRP